ncbi:MAG: hypothetical protein K2M65_07670, partial [Muribaculaceae bacterium]|nr:hypothetical protein [Muribaculaceae bacterium]
MNNIVNWSFVDYYRSVRCSLYRFGMRTFAILACMSACAVLLTACSDKSDEGVEPVGVSSQVMGMYLPSFITVVDNESFTIKGTGYQITDVVCFESTEGVVYKAITNNVTATAVEVTLPADMPTGDYAVTLLRADGMVQKIGSGTTRIIRKTTFDIPDKENMNIKGAVTCGGRGLSGVVVSDGYEVTATDADGYFWMKSDKKDGLVFISIPSGYMPVSVAGIPQFFQRLRLGVDKTEQFIFELSEEPNDDCVVLAMADAHLANRSSHDISQFQSGFIPDVNTLIASYQREGKKVYGITLGDQSWDAYWYDNNYGIKDAGAEFSGVNCPI